MFLGAFTLLVLPLFLIIAADMTKNSEFGKTFAGKTLEIVFYIFAAAGIATAIYLFTLI